MVPHELALQFVEFHHLAVQFAGDVGFPVLRDLRELFREVDLLHRTPSPINREASSRNGKASPGQELRFPTRRAGRKRSMKESKFHELKGKSLLTKQTRHDFCHAEIGRAS